MKTYNLSEAAALLGVSVVTLRRWRAAAGGAGERGTADRRRVWLSRAELAGLARAHGRLLVDLGAPGGVDVSELVREVAQLRARVSELEAKIERPG